MCSQRKTSSSKSSPSQKQRQNNEITNEELSQAVALFYDGNQAPTVTAKGVGDTAEEIIEIARQNNIPLCDNPGLVALLGQLEIGDNIPESLYVAIAHIIAFAYQLQQKSPDTTSDLQQDHDNQ